MFRKHHPMKHYSNTIDNSTKKGTLVLAASQIQMKSKLNNVNANAKNPGGTAALKTVEQVEPIIEVIQNNNFTNNDNGNQSQENVESKVPIGYQFEQWQRPPSR
jgi:hypothetical protein